MHTNLISNGEIQIPLFYGYSAASIGRLVLCDRGPFAIVLAYCQVVSPLDRVNAIFVLFQQTKYNLTNT